MRYYTFEMDGQKIGYYEEQDTGSVFYAKAYLLFEGQIVENPFWLRYKGDTILAYRVGSGAYQPFEQPEGVYPSSATHLLTQKMVGQETFTYQSFSEREERVTAVLTLKRQNNRIEEYDGEKLVRYFVMQEGQVQEYGWGGTAKSCLVNSLAEAKADTVF